MKTFLNFVFFLSVVSTSAQTVNGSVYDSISAIENIKITNLSSNKITASDANGTFSIAGKIGDTLHVSSLFYNEQKVVLKGYHFHESVVIELKKITNNLDEVELITPYKERLETIVNIEAALGKQIANDRKNNPHLYTPGGLNPNMDFIKIFGLIGKLFKNKDKYIEPPFVVMTYEDLESLFENSSVFNQRFLIQDLAIKKEYIPMFFEFIIKNELDSKLLQKDKEVDLIEIFVQKGNAFNKIIADYKKKQ